MSPQNEEGPPDVTGVFSALVAGFRLNRKDQALLLRVFWVLVVSAHIAWACGWLTTFGLIGFARANDVDDLKRITSASARVTLSKEIRDQSRVRCSATDQVVIDSITRYIDSLQNEYERIAGQRYPEPECRRP